jgi:myo-inositol-1(or 4)-monophosphatase
MAAGTLLVAEAGGAIGDMKGQPHSVTASDHLLADNGAVHAQILELFNEIFHGQFREPIPQISC